MPMFSGSRSTFSTMPMAARGRSPWETDRRLITMLVRSYRNTLMAVGTPMEKMFLRDSGRIFSGRRGTLSTDSPRTRWNIHRKYKSDATLESIVAMPAPIT